MERSPGLAADAIVLLHGKLVLVKRRFPSFKGWWALPGGCVDYGETVEAAVKREVKEETGLEVTINRLVGVYSDPQRDPKAHVVSVCFVCDVVGGKLAAETAETIEVNTFPRDRLPRLAYDHHNMLADAGVLGKKVMVGGKFNILHPGHLVFLQEAKKLGNRLVVVVANDKTITRNNEAVVMPAADRKKIVESLGIVDKVLIGDERDFFKVVEQERPDIIALGYDQKMDEEWLRERLGKSTLPCKIVKLTTKLDGYGTRKLIEKIRIKK